MGYIPESTIKRLIKYSKPYCCGSCHDDAETYEDTGEYQLIAFNLGKDRYTELCCEVISEYEDWCKKKGYTYEYL